MALVVALIEDGGLAVGDRLPTNDELAALAGVSLISVRRALAELERAGRVRRHQGVGTFVSAEPIVADPLEAGELRATLVGEEPPAEVVSELLDAGLAKPGELVARALRIPRDALVWHVVRLRRIGPAAAMLEEATVPLALAPDLDLDALGGGASLYGLLAERHGVREARAEQFLRFSIASPSEARLLSLPPRASVARLRGVTFTALGVPFDCFQHVYPAHEFVFSMSNSPRRARLVPHPDVDWVVYPVDDGRS